MPSVSPVFSTGGFALWSYFARRDARRPLAKQLRRRHQRRQRGAGHGDRAQMPRLELRGEIEARRAHLMAAAGLGRAVLPDRGMQPARHRAPHQRVIGRVEIHSVDAPALPVMRAQRGRLGVGHAAPCPAPPATARSGPSLSRSLRTGAEESSAIWISSGSLRQALPPVIGGGWLVTSSVTHCPQCRIAGDPADARQAL